MIEEHCYVLPHHVVNSSFIPMTPGVRRLKCTTTVPADFDVLGLCTSGGIEALKMDWKGIYMALPSNPRVLAVRNSKHNVSYAFLINRYVIEMKRRSGIILNRWVQYQRDKRDKDK